MVWRPTGALDEVAVSGFHQALAGLLGSPTLTGRPKLVIDLSRVTFVDSAGLDAVTSSIRWIQELDGLVIVACSRPTMARVLRRTGFDRLVTLADTVEEAIAELNPPDPDGGRA